MTPDLELQVALAGRILKKTPDEIVHEAVRLFCRSIVGGVAPALRGRPRANAVDVAAKRASQAPGSFEARIVAFIREQDTPSSPGYIAARLKVDKHRLRRVIGLLVSAGKLRVTGATANRRVSLA